MSTDTIDQQATELEFPLTLASNQVEASKIVIEADLMPSTLKLIGSALRMISDGESVQIDGAEDYAIAVEQTGKIKGVMKDIDEQRKAITKPMDDEKKRVMDSVRPFVDALTAAEALFKNGMIAYNQEQQRKQALADAEAEKQRRLEEEKLNARAEKAEAKGNVEQADALRMQAASTVVAAPVVAEVVKPKGVSSTKKYSAEVRDFATLAKAAVAPLLLVQAQGNPEKLFQIVSELAATPVPIQALTADTKFLDQQAKAFKEAFSYPGCKLSAAESLSIRSK